MAAGDQRPGTNEDVISRLDIQTEWQQLEAVAVTAGTEGQQLGAAADEAGTGSTARTEEVLSEWLQNVAKIWEQGQSMVKEELALQYA